MIGKVFHPSQFHDGVNMAKEEMHEVAIKNTLEEHLANDDEDGEEDSFAPPESAPEGPCEVAIEHALEDHEDGEEHLFEPPESAPEARPDNEDVESRAAVASPVGGNNNGGGLSCLMVGPNCEAHEFLAHLKENLWMSLMS